MCLHLEHVTNYLLRLTLRDLAEAFTLLRCCLGQAFFRGWLHQFDCLYLTGSTSQMWTGAKGNAGDTHWCVTEGVNIQWVSTLITYCKERSFSLITSSTIIEKNQCIYFLLQSSQPWKVIVETPGSATLPIISEHRNTASFSFQGRKYFLSFYSHFQCDGSIKRQNGVVVGLWNWVPLAEVTWFYANFQILLKCTQCFPGPPNLIRTNIAHRHRVLVKRCLKQINGSLKCKVDTDEKTSWDGLFFLLISLAHGTGILDNRKQHFFLVRSFLCLLSCFHYCHVNKKNKLSVCEHAFGVKVKLAVFLFSCERHVSLQATVWDVKKRFFAQH